MWLKNAIKSHPKDRIALRDSEKQITYGALLSEIEHYGDALYDVTVLGIALDNSVDWILWDLAAMMNNIPCVPLPPFFSSEQINYVIRTAGITHIISETGLRAVDNPVSSISLPEGTAKITFTSGTTAEPKGVCLSVKAMENVSTSISSLLGESFIQTHVSVLPLSILLENVAGTYTALVSGCTIDIPSLKLWGKDYRYLHGFLRETKTQSIILVPEILRILIQQTSLRGPLKDLRFIAVGGAKIDSELIYQAKALGLPVYEGYGLSEAGSVVSMNTPQNNIVGTTGRILPHVNAFIEGDELCLKNEGFLGYIGERAPVILKTGDIAAFDDGFLSITGRKKNIIITSLGRNISPEWIEAALMAHPSIYQAIVYGEAQPSLSGLIVTAASYSDTLRIIEEINKTLPSYARITSIRIVPPFTAENGQLTGNGRPKREAILSTHVYKKEKDNEFLRQIG